MDDLAREIHHAVEGDEAGYRALYLRFGPRVRRLLSGFASLDADEAEDVLQDSFVRAFKSLPKLRSPAAFEPWLLATARNVALTRLARRSEESKWAERLKQEWGTPSVGIVPEALKVELDVAVVRQLIADLPPGPERQTVELFYVEGELSAREIALQLGVSKGAITMRLDRFRARVKQLLVKKLLDAAVD